jgi:beta-phosphoglucomutase family hydrolase
VTPFGVIFDWDGVIVDSSAAHAAAWERLAAAEALPLPPRHFEASFGRKNEFAVEHILGWGRDPAEIVRLSRRKEELYRTIVRERGITLLPGVREFLGRLQAADVPCAIGSSTERKNLDTVLAIIGLESRFQAVVSADDVTLGKPNPQVFLLAARTLRMPPARCVVFEDALVGIEAARAGGMKVVGVATTHPAQTLAAADRVVRRLDELSVADLVRLLQR